MLCAHSHSCSDATQASLDTCLDFGPQATLVSLRGAQRVQTASACLLSTLRLARGPGQAPAPPWSLGVTLTSLKHPLHSSPGDLARSGAGHATLRIKPTPPSDLTRPIPLPWLLPLFPHLSWGRSLPLVGSFQISLQRGSSSPPSWVLFLLRSSDSLLCPLDLSPPTKTEALQGKSLVLVSFCYTQGPHRSS